MSLIAHNPIGVWPHRSAFARMVHFLPLPAIILCLCLLLPASVSAASVNIDGSQTFQIIDGFGVNANHRAWNNDELKPVLDHLIDDAGMTLFRVVYENADWEGTNDNSDPNVMNWSYYSQVYSSPDFQKMWSIMGYLNQKGITNGLMPNFQGFGPWWMGQPFPDYRSLASGMEDEWAEMIASALVWARYTNHLQFTMVGPNNEPDLPGSGFGISNGVQYALTLHSLVQQLDAHGLSDLRFVGPDLGILGSTNWFPEIMADSTVMARFGHFGVHSYSCCGNHSEFVADYIAQSPFPDRTFWMTEFNVDCHSCQYNGFGTNSWHYARGQAEYLLSFLANNASAAFAWDAYDSPYLSNSDDSINWTFWGLFAVNTTNDVPKTYTPRKGFYTLSQITKYVKPGAVRIGLNGSTDSLQLLAFYHPATGQLTITGVNSDSSSAILSGTLQSLPDIAKLGMTWTTSGNNLSDAGSISVSNGVFSVSIPADSVFTLVGFSNAVEYVAGSYHGLFQQDERDHAHSGSLTLRLTSRGTYTGSLRRGANSFSIHGSFDLAGHAKSIFTEFRTNLWTVSMDLGHSAGSNWITGIVSNSSLHCELLAERSPFDSRRNPALAFAGYYTFIIPGQTNGDGSILEGDGFGTVFINAAGNAVVKGTVADGTAFQTTVQIGDGGECPIYAFLNRHDSVLGWLTNVPASGLTGSLSWIKTTNASARLYPGGLTNLSTVTGWQYAPPTKATGGIVTITNGLATFEGIALDAVLLNAFTNANGKILDQTVSNRFSLRLSPASGTFTGAVKPPGFQKPALFRGAISQPLGFGFGFIPFTNTSGRVTLSNQ